MSAVWPRSPSSSASPKFFGENNNGDDNRQDEDWDDDYEDGVDDGVVDKDDNDEDEEDEVEILNLHARLQPRCRLMGWEKTLGLA